MKLVNWFLTVALVLFVSIGCLSTRARQSVLLPSIRTAWPAVQADVAAGIQDADSDGIDVTAVRAAVEELDSAIVSGDELLIVGTPWAIIEPYGERGVSAKVASGEISPLVAPSLLERIRQFGQALAKMRLYP